MKKVDICTCLLTSMCCLLSLNAQSAMRAGDVTNLSGTGQGVLNRTTVTDVSNASSSSPKGIPVDAIYESRNGLHGLLRDLTIKLLGKIPENKKIRNVIGMCQELYEHSKHPYFEYSVKYAPFREIYPLLNEVDTLVKEQNADFKAAAKEIVKSHARVEGNLTFADFQAKVQAEVKEEWASYDQRALERKVRMRLVIEKMFEYAQRIKSSDEELKCAQNGLRRFKIEPLIKRGPDGILYYDDALTPEDRTWWYTFAWGKAPENKGLERYRGQLIVPSAVKFLYQWMDKKAKESKDRESKAKEEKNEAR